MDEPDKILPRYARGSPTLGETQGLPCCYELATVSGVRIDPIRDPNLHIAGQRRLIVADMPPWDTKHLKMAKLDLSVVFTGWRPWKFSPAGESWVIGHFDGFSAEDGATYQQCDCLTVLLNKKSHYITDAVRSCCL